MLSLCSIVSSTLLARSIPPSPPMLSCPEYKGKTAYFGAINQAKFKRKVVPGDVLMLEVEMIKKKGPIGIGKAVATVEGEVAVSAELTFAIG